MVLIELQQKKHGKIKKKTNLGAEVGEAEFVARLAHTPAVRVVGVGAHCRLPVDVEVGAVLGGDVLAALLVEVGGGAPLRRVRAVTAQRQRWVIAIEKKENSIIM